MDKKQTKRLKAYIEENMTLILNIRSKILDGGSFVPNYIYISDRVIWDPRNKNDLEVNKWYFDAGATVYGMKVLLDWRVPMGQFFLTQAPLEAN